MNTQRHGRAALARSTSERIHCLVDQILFARHSAPRERPLVRPQGRRALAQAPSRRSRNASLHSEHQHQNRRAHHRPARRIPPAAQKVHPDGRVALEESSATVLHEVSSRQSRHQPGATLLQRARNRGSERPDDQSGVGRPQACVSFGDAAHSTESQSVSGDAVVQRERGAHRLPRRRAVRATGEGVQQGRLVACAMPTGGPVARLFKGELPACAFARLILLDRTIRREAATTKNGQSRIAADDRRSPDPADRMCHRQKAG